MYNCKRVQTIRIELNFQELFDYAKASFDYIISMYHAYMLAVSGHVSYQIVVGDWHLYGRVE